MITLAKTYTDSSTPSHRMALEVDPNYRDFDTGFIKSTPTAMTFTAEALAGTSSGWVIRAGKDTNVGLEYYLAADSRSFARAPISLR